MKKIDLSEHEEVVKRLIYTNLVGQKNYQMLSKKCDDLFGANELLLKQNVATVWVLPHLREFSLQITDKHTAGTKTY